MEYQSILTMRFKVIESFHSLPNQIITKMQERNFLLFIVLVLDFQKQPFRVIRLQIPFLYQSLPALQQLRQRNVALVLPLSLNFVKITPQLIVKPRVDENPLENSRSHLALSLWIGRTFLLHFLKSQSIGPNHKRNGVK